MSNWVKVCPLSELEEEDVMRFDHDGATYAVYRLEGEQVYATDGLCTHEYVHLADGLVIDGIIECPRHNGRFDVLTGEAKEAPACIDLTTYEARVVEGQIEVNMP